MTRRLSAGWASLLALILVGLVPTGHPTGETVDRAFARSSRECAPLGTTPAGLRRPGPPSESLRPNHAGGAALTAWAPQPALHLIVVSASSTVANQAFRPTPVALGHYPTGPPTHS